MEAKQLIKAHPTEERRLSSIAGEFLRISEFFFDTIQGEGINLGQPAAFLRLQQCTLNCIWCDTNEVWRHGNPYSFDELIQMIANTMLADKLQADQHLVLTGGSPLLQQGKLARFITKFISYFGFKPYIEVENECVLLPEPDFAQYVDCWNNSPKLMNSGNSLYEMHDAFVIGATAALPNSWFKFVITDPSDWDEIEERFLDSGLIERKQIILMPEGATRDELKTHTEMVVELAIQKGVLYRSREHIVLWNRMTGI